MLVERLQTRFHATGYQRFVIFYGEGLADSFIGSDYAYYETIEQLVWRWLRDRGIKHIVFHSNHRGPDYLDNQTREWVHGAPPAPAQATEAAQRPQMQHFRNGPLGGRMVITPPASPATSPAHSDGSRMSAAGVMHLLDGVMRRPERSAVVFVQAATTLRMFRDQSGLAGFVGEWARLPAANGNLCCWLFTGDRDQITTLGEVIPELSGHVTRDNSTVVRIGPPSSEEVRRLIDRERLNGRLSVDWHVRQHIERIIEAEGHSLKECIRQLGALTRLDHDSTRSWLKGTGDPRSALERLNDLIGLEPVKQRIRLLAAVADDARERGQLEDFSLHLVFTGNPGTGKTTVARLIGEIYRDLGLLRRGHTREARVAELISDHVGGTARATDHQLDLALDGVLFVDEAYQLTEPDRGAFGKEALDTIMTRAENDRGRLAVIMAGYTGKMKAVLDANPGLQRRFPHVIEFPDYQPEELLQILLGMLRARGLSWTVDCETQYRQVVEGMYRTRNEKFGNAGEMRNLAEALISHRAARRLHDGLPGDAPLDPVDLPDTYRTYLTPSTPPLEQLFARLNRLIGLTGVKQGVRELVALASVDQMRRSLAGPGEQQPRSLHMVFTGNPGTGKTTVARLMGEIYRALDMLRKGHMVECRAADLIAGYVGQTALKTREKVEEALDGVLFIDEAYDLTPNRNSFAAEAVTELLAQMENRRDRLIVIIAGYGQEIEALVASNPGLRARFTQYIEFPDYSPGELGQIFSNLAEQRQITLADGVREAVERYLDNERFHTQGFANGRAVRNLFESMERRMAARITRAGLEVTRANLRFETVDLPEQRFGSAPPTPSRPADSTMTPVGDTTPVDESPVAVPVDDATPMEETPVNPPVTSVHDEPTPDETLIIVPTAPVDDEPAPVVTPVTPPTAPVYDEPAPAATSVSAEQSILERFLQERGISIVGLPPAHPADAVLDSIARLIGERLQNVQLLLQRIKANQAHGQQFKLHLANQTPACIADMTLLATRLHDHAMLTEYRYQRQPHFQLTATPSTAPMMQNFFSGQWLERYVEQVVTDHLRRRNRPYAVLANVKILLASSNDFELDLLIQSGTTYCWLESKTGAYQQAITKYASFGNQLQLSAGQRLLVLADPRVTAELAQNLSALHDFTVLTVQQLADYLNVVLPIEPQSADVLQTDPAAEANPDNPT